MKPLLQLSPEQFTPIRVLILDVDGVLTDGRIIFSDNGMETKSFHVRDGAGLKYWQRAGHRAAFLSGRECSVVRRRADEVGVMHVIMGAKQKLPALEELLRSMQVDAAACAYVGDDLVDIPVMRTVGLGLAVADAAQDVKDAADGVTQTKGGRGAVREVVEAILRAQNRWDAILDRYRP